MSISRRRLLAKTAAAGIATICGDTQLAEAKPLASPSDQDPESTVEGPFEPNWDSLRKYKCPEWFRDAKFGIWAHWTAQCVPEMGDWYARSMYEEGSDDYKDHLIRYGHPSKAGFKDIDHIWHAENWDPERLIALYKKAGANYFVALANHHDNFDCFDSKHQPWNATKIGPMKDLVGGWAKAARKAGMRFGVTCHASRSWAWFEVAQGADKKGPMAGVPYDGKLTTADGKGLWWDGLDPQDLYAQNHLPGKGLEWDWDASKGSSIPDKAYCERFYNRVMDLIESYHPDLVYFDDNILPLYQVSDVGLRIAANYYNGSMKRHGGNLEAVLNGKGLDEEQRQAMVHDFERGRSDKIEDAAWQTDTCIGEWHYRRSLYTNKGYKTTAQVVKMLVDIVSKNGNLLLNIPVRGDGTIDAEEEKFLEGMAAWMAVNSEAIYSTRPWKIAGEGPVKVKGGGFSEGGEERLGAQDFRFTTRGNTLYAAAMGWPKDGKLAVRVLASGASGIKGGVRSVSLLGAAEKLKWERTPSGLEVTLPEKEPCEHAWVLKITGLDVAGSEPVPPSSPPPAVV